MKIEQSKSLKWKFINFSSSHYFIISRFRSLPSSSLILTEAITWHKHKVLSITHQIIMLVDLKPDKISLTYFWVASLEISNFSSFFCASDIIHVSFEDLMGSLGMSNFPDALSYKCRGLWNGKRMPSHWTSEIPLKMNR